MMKRPQCGVAVFSVFVGGYATLFAHSVLNCDGRDYSPCRFVGKPLKNSRTARLVCFILNVCLCGSYIVPFAKCPVRDYGITMVCGVTQILLHILFGEKSRKNVYTISNRSNT